MFKMLHTRVVHGLFALLSAETNREQETCHCVYQHTVLMVFRCFSPCCIGMFGWVCNHIKAFFIPSGVAFRKQFIRSPNR